jgi:hypothetical protein
VTRRARFTFEPLTDWPYPETPRIRAPFSARWTATRDLLLAEADHLGANLVVVELDLTRNHLRNDGEIRANARPASGRARLTMDTRHGALRYAVDRYIGNGDVPGWQANLRAIALTLQALRAVDRYGAVHDGEQYQGFLAIEAAPAGPRPFTSADEALRWARSVSGTDATDARQVYRAAARVLHPDSGGSPDDWARLDEARRLFEASGLWSAPGPGQDGGA